MIRLENFPKIYPVSTDAVKKLDLGTLFFGRSQIEKWEDAGSPLTKES